MCISKISTLTSGFNVLTSSVLELEVSKAEKRSILVIDDSFNSELSENDLVEYICAAEYKVVISSRFTSGFYAKAMSCGIFTLKVSSNFIDNIISIEGQDNIKLFVDFSGREIMIINTGEKFYFNLSESDLEVYNNGKNDIENLHEVWHDINYARKPEYVYACAID